MTFYRPRVLKRTARRRRGAFSQYGVHVRLCIQVCKYTGYWRRSSSQSIDSGGFTYRAGSQVDSIKTSCGLVALSGRCAFNLSHVDQAHSEQRHSEHSGPAHTTSRPARRQSLLHRVHLIGSHTTCYRRALVSRDTAAIGRGALISFSSDIT